MPKSTDDMVSEFLDLGLSAEDAQEQALAYIAQSEFEGVRDFSESYEQDFESKAENLIPGLFEESYHGIRLGCDFKGVKEIKEYEDEFIYIPSSYHCLIKAANKYLKIKNNDEEDRISTKRLSYYGITLNDYKKSVIKSGLKYDEVPKVYKWDSKRYVPINRNLKRVKGFIAAIWIHDKYFHAVLIKPAAIRETPSGRYKCSIDQEYISKRAILEYNKKLSPESTYLRPIHTTNTVDCYYSFDIETYSTKTRHKLKGGKTNIRNILVPMGAAYQEIKFSTSGPIYSEKWLFEGEDCLDQMFDHVAENRSSGVIKKSLNGSYEEFHFFAHNGGAFDIIFTKSCKNLILEKQIKGQKIKSLTAKIACDSKIEKKIVFQDSYQFTQASLKDSAKIFNTSRKIDLDIKGKSKDWYLNNRDLWIPYLNQDVQTLSEVLYNFDKYLREIGETICGNCGIPGVAWKVMMKSCFGLRKVKTFSHPVTRRFIRDSIKGGRILHWESKYNKTENSPGLICLDGNSLYPSAMWLGRYPIGEGYVFPKNIDTNYIDELIFKKRLFIAEVTFDAGNVRRPFIPYKDEKGLLSYRAGQFTDVYTSPDIIEALRLEYKIIEIRRGIYWNQSGRIFKDFIESIYNERLKAQEENNPFEYTLKILLNSCYGKFLELIRTISSFGAEKKKNGDQRLISKTKLKNGQTEYEYTYTHPKELKPTHIGAFILGYSRAIMNDLIQRVGTKNITYGDTDSIYVKKDAFDRSGIKEVSGLCGFKNDYGKGMIIEEAIFLDLKRYLLLFNKANKKASYFTAKFSGLCFKTENSLQNWYSSEDIINTPEDRKILKELENKVEEYEINIQEGKEVEESKKHLEISKLDLFTKKEEISKKEREILSRLYIDYYNHNIIMNKNPNHKCIGNCPINKGVYQEKWNRLKTGVTIDEKQMKYVIDRNCRANWKNKDDYEEFYPLGYDFEKEEREIKTPDFSSTQTEILKKGKNYDHYILSRYTLNSSLPLASDRTVILKKDVFLKEEVKNKNFITNFVLSLDRKEYFKYEREIIDDKVSESFYEMTPLGALRRRYDVKDFLGFIVTIELDDKSQEASLKKIGGSQYIDKEKRNKLLMQINSILKLEPDDASSEE